ncbi:MAG: serine/threonine protein kinase, partial [Planctomycetota bacterium]
MPAPRPGGHGSSPHYTPYPGHSGRGSSAPSPQPPPQPHQSGSGHYGMQHPSGSVGHYAPGPGYGAGGSGAHAGYASGYNPNASPYHPGNLHAKDLPSGTVIDGKYRIQQKLGRGGMGAVYIAEDVLLQRQVAIKLIAGRVAQDPNFRARFFREAKVALEFVHRHAITVRNFGATPEGMLYMTMDLSSGQSLRELIQQSGHLDPARACRVVRQVLEAL